MTMGPHDGSGGQMEMLRFECAYCGALAGQWCVAKSGGRAGYLHSARYYQWREAMNNGN